MGFLGLALLFGGRPSPQLQKGPLRQLDRGRGVRGRRHAGTTLVLAPTLDRMGGRHLADIGDGGLGSVNRYRLDVTDRGGALLLFAYEVDLGSHRPVRLIAGTRR